MQRRNYHPAQPAFAGFPNVREPAVVTFAERGVDMGQRCQRSEKQARVEDLSIHLKLIHMCKAGFYIRRLPPLSGDVKTDVGILRENPTADHPVFACSLTRRLLGWIFEHHNAGRKGALTFIHVLPRFFPLYDMRVSIDHRHRLTPSFFKSTTTL